MIDGSENFIADFYCFAIDFMITQIETIFLNHVDTEAQSNTTL